MMKFSPLLFLKGSMFSGRKQKQPVVREIAKLGNPVLRKIAEPVTDFDSAELQTIIQDMRSMLEKSNGVGIAAPQISESIRLMIIASRPNDRYPDAPKMKPVVMINPVFSVLDSTVIKGWEGCLSIPGIRAQVPRYQAVQVNFQNPAGEKQAMDLQGFVARIFQHEYDHLEGRVYLDHVVDNKDIIAESEYFKLK